jgi:hypothetical protein
MSITASIKSAYRRIDVISAREFRIAVFICIVIAALNALFLAYRFGYMDGNDANGCFRAIHRDYFYDFMRLKIEGALLVIGIALWFRRVVGFCISLLATVFVAIKYALWYLETQRWLREMRVSDFSQLPVPSEWQHFAGLYRATPWDVLLLAFTTALFVWQVRVLLALVSKARKPMVT